MANKEKRDERYVAISKRMDVLKKDIRYNTAFQVLYTGLLMDNYLSTKTRQQGGASRPRNEVLHTLVAHGGELKPTELSKMLFVSKQTIGTLCDGLEKDGLVTREFLQSDRRVRFVKITDKGVNVVEKSISSSKKAAELALPPMSKKDADDLVGMLRIIRKHLIIKLREGSVENSDQN